MLVPVDRKLKQQRGWDLVPHWIGSKKTYQLTGSGENATERQEIDCGAGAGVQGEDLR